MKISLNPAFCRADSARSAGRIALLVLGAAGAGLSLRAADQSLDFDAVRVRAE